MTRCSLPVRLKHQHKLITNLGLFSAPNRTNALYDVPRECLFIHVFFYDCALDNT